MATEIVRTYACSDDELPVICGFASYSLTRDLSDFSAYSSKFDAGYVTRFDTNTAAVSELVAPESETIVLKASSARLYAVFENLPDPVNRLEGYIGLAEKDLQISPDDFGLKALRKSFRAKEAEGTLDSLHNINANIKKYKDLLVKQGLTDDLINRFISFAETIAVEKKLQYKILTNRRAIVQDNIDMMNTLNQQLVEILKVGKILYNSNNPARTKEYTFTDLKKRVRRESKPEAAAQKVKKSKKSGKSKESDVPKQ